VKHGDSVASVAELPAKVVLAAARVDGRVRGRRPHVLIVRHGDTLYSIARRNRMDVDTLAAMNGMQADDALRAGQRIRVASTGGRSSGHGRSHRVLYTVRNGDTVAGIAQLFQCSASQIVAWNGLGPHPHLHEGQKLRIHVIRHG
jgi:membrane-bound lytic murein transglycosylase D